MAISSEQLHVLQHALGLDEYGRGSKNRNRYVCDPEPLLQSLVELGLMRDCGPNRLADGMHLYVVTPEGEAAVERESPRPPKVSRGRARYLEWLRVSDAFPDWSFGDWLKHGAQRATQETT